MAAPSENEEEPLAVFFSHSSEDKQLVRIIANDEGRQFIVPLLLDDIADAVIEKLIGDRIFAGFRKPEQFLHSIAVLLRSFGLL